MLSLLAQGGAAPATDAPKSDVFAVMTEIFSHGDSLAARPGQVIDTLHTMSVVWAVILLIVGLLCLFNGYRFYRVATVVLALMIGSMIGYALGDKIGAKWVVAGCMGILLAVCCYPLMKYAVAALGGLAGAFIGANTWAAVARLSGNEASAHNYWVGALIGLIVCGMLAFILFKFCIVMFTSVSGSTIAVLGAITLLLQFDFVQQGIKATAAHPRGGAIILPMLILVPAIIGLVLQQRQPDVKAPA